MCVCSMCLYEGVHIHMSENIYSFGVGSNDDSLKQNKNMMIGIKYMMEQRKKHLLVCTIMK